ncbi:MAG: hypothetical protein IT352_15465 [Gemmatimonadales bacterium]|nr:hypothetical protein [Gemmatimonadales bacterium]
MGNRHRQHRSTRRRAYGRRGHELGERARDAWEAAELEAADDAAELEAHREATDAIPIAYTTVTHDDWVLTEREARG